MVAAGLLLLHLPCERAPSTSPRPGKAMNPAFPVSAGRRTGSGDAAPPAAPPHRTAPLHLGFLLTPPARSLARWPRSGAKLHGLVRPAGRWARSGAAAPPAAPPHHYVDGTRDPQPGGADPAPVRFCAAVRCRPGRLGFLTSSTAKPSSAAPTPPSRALPAAPSPRLRREWSQIRAVPALPLFPDAIVMCRLPCRRVCAGAGSEGVKTLPVHAGRQRRRSRAPCLALDNYLEEAFKMRNVLEEFRSEKYGKRKPTILGLREHIFTGSVSSLAWFMSNQETSFVTIGQRVLANPLKVRFHYGHPDIFDRLFHITRGGISKASKTINLSEDIFSGFNSTMREGNVTHHEYMQVGKGRDVGMNQISSFEAKVANGSGEQTLSRDIYRLGHSFDFYRMLSFYFTTVGFYFSSMVTILTVYVFLYGRLYLVMSGLERSILLDPRIQDNIKPLENALASQSIFQLGLLLVLPMVMEVGLEKGFRTALGEFVIMQLQLASVFFTFQLGTKTHYYGRTILHGGAQYRPTGRGFVVYHAKFAENYRMYSRSHFVKGLELLILLVVYVAYGSSYHSSNLYLFVTFSIWYLVASWLFAPFIFNPSCFEWQKTVDDWTDWRNWMGNRGGIGMSVEQSWEAWWIDEQKHLRKTSIRSLLLEIILSLRFLIYQYGIVYHLNIAHRSRSILVYALSWLVMLTVIVVLKMVSVGRQKFGNDLQLMFRVLKGLLFLGFVFVMAVLFLVCNLTISDVFASILGFLPTGWCILLISQACSPLVKKTALWDSIMELGRAYENIMGLILFVPVGFLSWFPFVSEFQTRLLFNQAFSRGLQISRILAGQKDFGELE